jgi:tetratricopeptide (TPR) repeat protein
MHMAMAELLQKQGDQDAAIQHLQMTLQLNPRQHEAHTALGLILKLRGDYKQAIQHFSEALRLDPDDSIAAENLQQLQAEHNKKGNRTS